MSSNGRPGYLALHASGRLRERAELLEEDLRSCTLCPRECKVDRTAGQFGACRVGPLPMVASISLHPWEEPPISGVRGSGTVFFSGCTLKCIFCQNYPISQMGVGRILSVEELAHQMLKLQRKGAHNINLVTPTHQVAAFVRALDIAASRGLQLPVVYNTSGYEAAATLRLLEGIIDVYLPDIKYDDPDAARFCSRRADYIEHNRAALLEMWRQVGPIRLNAEGIARRGMLVRHLVLPEDLSGTRECLAFLAREMGPGVWVSLMNQYFPAHKAHRMPPLDRKVSMEEYEHALAALKELKLDNGFVQEQQEEDLSA